MIKTRLSDDALKACLNPANSLALSLASIWELQIKLQLGKLSLRLPLAAVIGDQLGNGLTLEAVSLEDILGLSVLPMVHRDPFDRLIIVEARRGAFHLVSHDPQVARYDVPVLW